MALMPLDHVMTSPTFAWLSGFLILISMWPTEFPETSGSIRKSIHGDGQQPSPLRQPVS